MKYISFLYKGQNRFGVWLEEEEAVLDCFSYFQAKGESVSTLLDFISKDRHDEIEILLQESKNWYHVSIEDITLTAPIQRPLKNIFCVGKNYKDHAIEMGSEKDIPTNPMIFTKAPTSIANPNELLSFSSEVSTQLDYEGELAIVIGKDGKGISREDAMDHVFGYTIVNDITARDLQKKHGQFFIGKSLDQSCPMGPVILHHSALEDPHKLNIVTTINGEVRQDGNTEDLIFDIRELVSVLSKGMTLEAGDIIATGTPSGVGKGFKPPKFLKHGDKIAISIEGIGSLQNEVNIG
ncbi:fumarylacetoacetate hydrolase family protein [Guptibacillus algicola]|uniref:fumarylacetoacetate hydrolase family protein n=1 Tax=Guptibacillus algicola TaxID=225844 RepID=UPI001CD2F2E2|nr:fumarylacetoacetate hydrolase family protein [Alkalihalobacillus algicola]MCA0987747.1 fumarylacetoacetate hydrolase family protein [Alkalihalobacillus algicola]